MNIFRLSINYQKLTAQRAHDCQINNLNIINDLIIPLINTIKISAIKLRYYEATITQSLYTDTCASATLTNIIFHQYSIGLV